MNALHLFLYVNLYLKSYSLEQALEKENFQLVFMINFKCEKCQYAILWKQSKSGGSNSKESAAMQETQVQTLGCEDPLEKGMAAHSTLLAWRIPWAEETGRPQSMRLQSQTWLRE